MPTVKAYIVYEMQGDGRWKASIPEFPGDGFSVTAFTIDAARRELLKVLKEAGLDPDRMTLLDRLD